MTSDSINSMALFIQSPPGLSEIVLNEWTEKATQLGIPFQVLKFEQSGIEIQTDQNSLGIILPYLKTPNRILIRLEHFKARDFPKLFAKTKKINWIQWMADVPEKIRVTSSQSRLIHSDRIEETIRDAIAQCFRAQPPKKALQQKWAEAPSELFVRLLDDEVLFSIDAAGERLGVRGYRNHVAPASMRENLAAACLSAFLKNDILKSSYTIADPMMGAGTILLEASEWNRPNLNRKYYFNHWNSLSAQSTELAINELVLIGNDLSPKMIETTKQNIKNIKTEMREWKINLEDFIESSSIYPEVQWVLSNAPYGERLEVQEGFFKKIIPALKQKYPNARMALLLPSDKWNSTRSKNQKIVDFKNGGLEVSLREILS